jgi:hypothetical protein
MRLDASSKPVRLGVHRQYEVNRLAKDCQARAYERVLPIAGRSEFTVVPNQADGEQEESETRTQEGVAA